MLITWPFPLSNMVAHKTCCRWTRWVCSTLEASPSSFLGYHLALMWVLVPVIMACSQLSQFFILGIVFLFSFSQSYLSLGSYFLILLLSLFFNLRFSLAINLFLIFCLVYLYFFMHLRVFESSLSSMIFYLFIHFSYYFPSLFYTLSCLICV
jgi:hypothetical protein